MVSKVGGKFNWDANAGVRGVARGGLAAGRDPGAANPNGCPPPPPPRSRRRLRGNRASRQPVFITETDKPVPFLSTFQFLQHFKRANELFEVKIRNLIDF